MGTPLPVEASGLFMALQAGGVTLRDRRGIFLRKGDQPVEGRAPRLHMSLAAAVTALAAEGLLGVSRVFEKKLAHGRGGELFVWVEMAGLADLRPHKARRKGWGGVLG